MRQMQYNGEKFWVECETNTGNTYVIRLSQQGKTFSSQIFVLTQDDVDALGHLVCQLAMYQQVIKTAEGMIVACLAVDNFSPVDCKYFRKGGKSRKAVLQDAKKQIDEWEDGQDAYCSAFYRWI